MPRSSQLSLWELDIAGHNKERPTAKGLVLGSESFRVVVLLKVHDFLAVRHYIDGHAVVAAIPETDQKAGLFCKN